MEIHTHSHTPRKKWTHYFWEFFMLFLAVTLGFFVENQREHYVEHLREKELARALYSEFYDDSITVASKIKLRSEKEKDLDYLSRYFRDSSLTSITREFYAAFTTGIYLINIYAFEPKDGILSQLRNSGSLRYFKSINLQKLFGDLAVCINDVRNRNDQEFQYFSDPVKPFLLKHFDFAWLDQLRKENPNSRLIDFISDYRQHTKTVDREGKILNNSSFNREEAANLVLFYKQVMVSTRSLQLNNYSVTNKVLLSELRKIYNIK